MSSLARQRKTNTLHVTIVSDNVETLDELQSYLRRAGVGTNGTKHVDKITERTPATSSAVIFFPDDFAASAVATALATLRKARPTLLIVVVTREPKRYEEGQDRATAPPVVVPKPAWGWTILDTIRARIDDVPAESRADR